MHVIFYQKNQHLTFVENRFVREMEHAGFGVVFISAANALSPDAPPSLFSLLVLHQFSTRLLS